MKNIKYTNMNKYKFSTIFYIGIYKIYIIICITTILLV